MPALDQEIDHKKPIKGTISPHTQHLIIFSGKSDWTSRIEDERDNGTAWGKATGDLKRLLGRKGEFHDAFNATLINTSSFATPSGAEPKATQEQGQAQGRQPEGVVDALLFPAFRYFRGLVPLANPVSTAISDSKSGLKSDSSSTTDSAFERLKDFVRSNLTPTPKDFPSTARDENSGTPDAATQASYLHSWPVTNPTILICSHGQRDSRCGTLGPVLHEEFRRYIAQRKPDDESVELATPSSPANFVASDVNSSRGSAESVRQQTLESQGQSIDKATLNSISNTNTSTLKSPTTNVMVNVGTISHIGGHKWAGNVIVYIPAGFFTGRYAISGHQPPLEDVSQRVSGIPPRHSLAGMGIWYGRVEPKHVEGIVEQTIMRGKVIKELFRGGLNMHGEVLRL